MSFLTKEDFNTHAYAEAIRTITRGDDLLLLAAIDAAEEEVKSYLLKSYDVDTIFAATGSDRNALLLVIVKDVAMWRLIVIANPEIRYEDRKDRYDQAIQWLKAVYEGMPTTLTKATPTEDTSGKSGGLNWGSNPKRNQHF